MRGIYEIRNEVNDKQYIGSSQDIERRWQEHQKELQKGTHSNPHLQNAWNKYGSKVFQFSIIEEVQNIEDLLEQEQIWLDIIFETSSPYNIATRAGGGYLGEEVNKRISEGLKGRLVTVTEETRQKMSVAKKGIPLSEEHCRNVSLSLIGHPPYAGMTGKQHTVATKQKMSVASKGKPKSKEAKQNMSKAKQQLYQSPERYIKWYVARFGKEPRQELLIRRFGEINVTYN